MKLIILNKKAFGLKAAKTAKAMGIGEIAFLDDDVKADDVLDGCHNFVLYLDDDTCFYPAYEDDALRMEWMNRIMAFGGNLASLIHPAATIGEGTRIIGGAFIDAGVRVGQKVTIKTGAVLQEGAVIPDGVTVEKGTTAAKR